MCVSYEGLEWYVYMFLGRCRPLHSFTGLDSLGSELSMGLGGFWCWVVYCCYHSVHGIIIVLYQLVDLFLSSVLMLSPVPVANRSACYAELCVIASMPTISRT